MAKKYYAVKKGRNPGLYTQWSKAQKEISGFSNAQFKSFTTKSEAEDYMNEDSHASFVLGCRLFWHSGLHERNSSFCIPATHRNTPPK